MRYWTTCEASSRWTALISLVREHSERVRPPRALWVPFDFGRTLGIPGDAAFQRRVVLAVLALLDAAEGPVLVDYPEEAPLADTPTGWTCPVSLKSPADTDDRSALLRALEEELAELAPWYDRAVGSDSVSCRVMSWPAWVLVTSTSGDSAVTTSSSVTEARLSWTSIGVSCPARTVTPSILAPANPSRLTVTT